MEEEKYQLLLQKLKVLDDKRLQAQQKIELYQAQISRACNKKVREWIFKKGNLVLAVRRPMVMRHKTKEKFQPKWEGICSRVSLLKQSTPSYNSRKQYAHDADQW